MSWISPRIWRSAKSKFNEDEPLNCAGIYTPEVLADIHSQGFDAIWMRGRLWELIRSKIYPELNDEKALQRTESLRKVIRDGRNLGVKVFLYFNEPLALSREHEFWKRHPEVVGEPYREEELEWDVLSFCTSKKDVQDFLRDSIGNLYDDLSGLGGVILITASEYQTHCWSHRARRKIGDAYLDRCLVNVECPSCRNREPADLVSELIGLWADQATKTKPAPEVWAWNWSWSIWYDHPQKEIIGKLPKGVKLLCDFERGGTRKQEIGEVSIDEYSLGYPGPSEQFVNSMRAGKEHGLSGCAKIQLGTTHEIATVPNLPLIPNLFKKLRAIDRMKLTGVMGSWNFGNSFTLNTAAFELFVMRDDLREDEERFLAALAKEYFSVSDPHNVVQAWKIFCRAFGEYPFSIKFLYFSPTNYAVAYPLKCEYEDRPMGPTWIVHHPFGDRINDCLGEFSLDKVIDAFTVMSEFWTTGLNDYNKALSLAEGGATEQMRHRSEELSCARMIGCQLRCVLEIFRFHRWRLGVIAAKDLHPPCKVPLDEQGVEIIIRQIANAKEALMLTQLDPRLGFHQEPQLWFYDPDQIQTSIDSMSHEIEGVRL